MPNSLFRLNSENDIMIDFHIDTSLHYTALSAVIGIATHSFLPKVRSHEKNLLL